MKLLHNLQDLRPYGINTLTGEACAYSQRILCDLDLAGYKLLCAAFGMPYHYPTKVPEGDNKHYQWQKEGERIQLTPPGWAPGWNEGIASVKLDYDAWLWIGIHALLTVDSCHMAIALHNKLNRDDKPGAKTGAVTGLLGLKGDKEVYTPAPYDWDAGKYTGEPPLLHLEHWTNPMPWFDYNGCAPGRTYSAPSTQPHRGGDNVHAITGRAL